MQCYDAFEIDSGTSGASNARAFNFLISACSASLCGYTGWVYLRAPLNRTFIATKLIQRRGDACGGDGSMTASSTIGVIYNKAALGVQLQQLKCQPFSVIVTVFFLSAPIRSTRRNLADAPAGSAPHPGGGRIPP